MGHTAAAGEQMLMSHIVLMAYVPVASQTYGRAAVRSSYHSLLQRFVIAVYMLSRACNHSIAAWS